MKKHFILAILSIMLLIANAAIYFYYFYPPVVLIKLNRSGRAPSKRELHLIHKMIEKPGFYHDTFCYLEDHGTMESVPSLIKALKHQEPPGPNGFSDCAAAHCVDALSEITGHRPENNTYEEWNEWWESKGSKVNKNNK